VKVAEKRRLKLAMGQMLVEGGQPEKNLARAVEMIAEAGRQGCQVVILPECLDLGWAHPEARQLAAEIPGSASDLLRQAASDAGLHVVAGLTERASSRVYNAAVLIDPGGQVLLKHRKINLLDIERSFYSTGDHLGMCETDCGIIGVNICADNFPESICRSVLYLRPGPVI
jgi:predicted amidohydrolase